MRWTVTCLLIFLNVPGETMESKITKYTFPNGLVLIHKQTKPLPTLGIKLFIKSGSINEPEDKAGITHLTQVLLLKGTKKRSAEQIALEIESVGGDISSGSSEDYSEISVSVTKKYFSKALELLSDVFLRPTFPEQELQKEKMVTLAAIKSRQDHIFSVAFDELMQNLYKEHPYGRLNLGTEETVQKITRDDIVNLYKEFYGVPNLVMVIVGDISIATVKKEINKYFVELPEVKPSEIKVNPVKLTEKKIISENKKFKQAYLMYGFHSPSIKDEDYPALKLLNTYLGAGMSSRLFQVLREEAGLGYEVHSFYPSRKDTSSFVVYLGLSENTINEAEQKIQAILEETKQNLIEEKKLTETKDYLRGTYLLGHQTNDRQAWHLGWWEIMGKGYGYDNEYLNELRKITAQDLRRVAREYFTDKYVVVILHPESNK